MVCLCLLLGILGAASAETTLSFIGQTGNYANSVKALAERRMPETGVALDVYDVAYASLHESIMLDLSSGAGSYDLVMTNASWLEECCKIGRISV